MHIPVLLHEVLEALNVQNGDTVLDATVGLGGHTKSILHSLGATGRLIGIDADKNNLELARENFSHFKEQVRLIHDNFENLALISQKEGIESFDAILFDLGLSSMHVDDGDKGFSFLKDGPLDMRFNREQGRTAADIVNDESEENLLKIFRDYGEEPRARQIAQSIVHRRKERRFERTLDLAHLVESLGREKGRHAATRIFQALRIAVNDELGVLERSLESAVSVLKCGGRIVVISYHSLEDRIVKHFFKRESTDCICSKKNPICICHHHAQLRILYKKPVRPSYQEIVDNPRSRSARLRAVIKI